MSTPDRAGWYDDPEDESRLRYFDGIIWTDNTVSRGPGARQQARTEAAAEQQPVSGPAPTTDVYGRPVSQPGQQTGWQPQAPGQPPAAGQSPVPRQDPGQTGTADGAVLADFGQRVGAFLIDAVVLGAIALIASGWAWWRFMADYWDWAMNAVTEDPSKVEGLSVTEVAGYLDYQYFFIAIGIVVVVQAVYGIGFLVAMGATPGKLAMGISVRRTDRPGPMGVGTAFMRMLLPLILRVLWGFTCLVEVVGRTLDLLWPLRNPRRQALHDKIAGTEVVVGRRAPRAPEDSGV